MAGESHLAIKAVALDAMGVIYSVADDLRDLLIPYLRRKGCTLPDGEIVARYRACYREGRPAETIWQDTGCAWQDGALERDFLGSYQLNQGAAEFLDAMQCAGITLFGLSNDVAEWAVARRHLFGLDSYFEGWVVSGEVKAYKPSPLIYERLLSMLPCSPSECLFVDDRIENLEAATPFGLRTVRFSLNGSDGFDTVADFGANILCPRASSLADGEGSELKASHALNPSRWLKAAGRVLSESFVWLSDRPIRRGRQNRRANTTSPTPCRHGSGR